MRVVGCLVYLVVASMVAARPAEAQVTAPLNAPLPALVMPAPSPSTRLESFVPEAGAVMTLGFEELGTIGRGRIFVEVRQVRDSKGNSASGVAVVVSESGTRLERAFVDLDEIPDVLRNLDALLSIRGNPTPLKKFESRFNTRGLLSFVAYSNTAGAIEYAVQVGRPQPATISNLDAVDVLKMRGMLEAAQLQLSGGAGSS
jgi:hypothetical protein